MSETVPKTTLRSFWRQLPREGRWLLSTVAIQLFGRGMTLPFTVIYLHEVRGIGLDVAGLVMAWIFTVGVLLTGPGGVWVDKYGARVVILVGCVVHMAGVLLLAFAESAPHVEKMLKAIVGFRIEITRLEGKWKALSVAP